MITNLLAVLIFGSLVQLGIILIANPLDVRKTEKQYAVVTGASQGASGS